MARESLVETLIELHGGCYSDDYQPTNVPDQRLPLCSVFSFRSLPFCERKGESDSSRFEGRRNYLLIKFRFLISNFGGRSETSLEEIEILFKLLQRIAKPLDVCGRHPAKNSEAG